MEFTRIDNDLNGNPRYVVHFLNFLHESERGFDTALSKAKAIGGKKYRAKWYGGGIVFQSNNTRVLEAQINEIASKPQT